MADEKLFAMSCDGCGKPLENTKGELEEASKRVLKGLATQRGWEIVCGKKEKHYCFVCWDKVRGKGFY